MTSFLACVFSRCVFKYVLSLVVYIAVYGSCQLIINASFSWPILCSVISLHRAAETAYVFSPCTHVNGTYITISTGHPDIHLTSQTKSRKVITALDTHRLIRLVYDPLRGQGGVADISVNWVSYFRQYISTIIAWIPAVIIDWMTDDGYLV